MRYITLIFAFLLILGLSSCEDFLNLAPELEISEGDVFENYLSTQGFLDNCYKALENNYSNWNGQGLQRNHVDAMSDFAASTYGAAIRNIMNTGDWYNRGGASEVGYDNGGIGGENGAIITNAFYSIRVANKIIAKVPEIVSITDSEKDLLLGQAYFMRAWNYFEIIRRWGGMPVFDKIYEVDDELDMERLTYQQSTEWLMSDCDEAFQLLPEEWDAANTGRVTKIAALALKSMAAIYAASPLMDNPVGVIDNHGYNKQWSETAAKCAYDALKYIKDKYPEKDITNGVPYEHIFYHEGFVGAESLWYFNSTGKNRNPDIPIHFQNIRFSKRNGNWGWAVTTPSQNLVDMFELADGTPFDWNNPEHAASPFTNRDPRFYNNILYPGRDYGVDNKNKTMYLETWEGGRDLNSNYTRSVPTGYLCIKWWWPEANGYTNGHSLYNYNAIYIRTTQLYLDYAEAMNEAYGPNSDPENYGMTAVEAINAVRNRVGMPGVQSQFTGSADLFRDRIRNERGIELMFENHRWFDIRRWMIAKDLFSDTYPIKGIKAIDTTPGQKDVSQKEFTYSVKDVDSEIRVFDTKHYWYPISRDHEFQLSNFKQNPGW
ncbi:RagB/SusD family nutrient uptake outer membrane protein [Draconibacterium sediminis]|uniref:RagB/SusD family nutrient uptake outer membrane protein n=1 Tax=Draconibacterium sediminis TaxID=1544798 RepID=UPI0005D2F519|nr:RagB/SusD family nutrient uptake outer membrane protein [Draconibacterium sediminis]